MIEVKEAVKIIESSIPELPKITVPLVKSLGRVLRQEIVADTDFPPFNRVMMDGIAVKYEDLQKGLTSFSITGVQAAGSPQLTLSGNGNCFEVMTGSVAPTNADVVIPYEDVSIDSEKKLAVVNIPDIKKGKNIHRKGTDKKKGDLLISEGTTIGPPEIAVAASVGMTELWVTKNPSVAIISTGDELVDISDQPLPHQIRKSNVYAIAAELKMFGIKSDIFHIKDEEERLVVELGAVLDSHDVLILSGGVSKGKFDFIPDVLEKLGVDKLFHRIKQKPGKPFWFGVKGDEKVVFAFPGNPVSTFLCFYKYFVPWVKNALGMKVTVDKKALLSEDFNIKTGLTYFLQVYAKIDEFGKLIAFPNVGRGSGDHANLLNSNAFLELPGNTFEFKKGEVFPLIPFRSL